ncbi:hypothetical protein AB0I72_24125 [Nocardiopsis sp. NPDC049922]|uniref:hypothetical protein n=1 Tax=Nocardiopsis sp. NPDC049922 TaxID=3155157 RepID=UPI0033F682B5
MGVMVRFLPLATLSTDTTPHTYWLNGALPSALLVSGCAAVVLATTRGRRPWHAVALALAVVLALTGAVRSVNPRDQSWAVSMNEAGYAGYPHDIAVIDDTETWRPIEAEETRIEAEFTVVYYGPRGLHLVLTSAPRTSFLGGGPDPLRWGCNDLDGLCAEVADGEYVVPLTGAATHARGSFPMDRVRTEVTPDLFVEVALARDSDIVPEPEELVEQVNALGVRAAEPEDLTEIARGVVEWNQPEPWFD